MTYFLQYDLESLTEDDFLRSASNSSCYDLSLNIFNIERVYFVLRTWTYVAQNDISSVQPCRNLWSYLFSAQLIIGGWFVAMFFPLIKVLTTKELNKHKSKVE